jgi:adenylate kinase
MKLMFVWIQWSWKWTQWRLLEEKYWFKILEMWWEFRRVIKSWTELWNKLKKILDSWNQVWDDLGKEVMKAAILDNKEENIIYDWFLRNEWNKEIIDELIPEYKIVFFDLDEETAKGRLLWRMYDKETGETFMSGTLINPKNWNTLIKRADDEETAIEKRIRLFFDVTMPVIESYNWNIIKINAKWNIEEIHDRIIKELWL